MARLTPRENSAMARWPWTDEFDRAFENILRPMRWIEEATSENFTPAIDVVERENEYLVRTDLPGVRKEDVNVTLENGVLTISAECKREHEEKEGGRVIRQERRYGRYARSLRLGTVVDERRVKASFKDGVLELVLPKAETAKPKKISVDVG